MAANSFNDEIDIDVNPHVGASSTYPVQCSALRKNGYVVIKGRPCKILDMSNAGGYGHTKVHLVGIDIFTGKKLEDLSLLTYNMDVPNVTYTKYSLISIDDGFLTLLTDSGSTKDDVKLPEGELGQKILADFEDGKEVSLSVLVLYSPWTACVFNLFFQLDQSTHTLFYFFSSFH
jgi:translation initiation factor 5A